MFVGPDGRVWVKDLGSRNGTRVNGIRIHEAELAEGAVLQLSQLQLAFEPLAERNALQVAATDSFGSLVGASVPIRTAFALLEKAAASEVTVLLTGESGTGKSQAAEMVHARSARAGKPLRIVDCAAVPASLLDSELFGHEKGAFTGATERRLGVFEEADGGTVFMDEIGDLPADLQPKLLRVLEARQVRRVGSNRHVPVNVRLIAATNRDLRAEVNAGRFRADLYFRLAVLPIHLPSLRERPGDIPLIAKQLLKRLPVDAATRRALLDPPSSLAWDSRPGRGTSVSSGIISSGVRPCSRCFTLRRTSPPRRGSTSRIRASRSPRPASGSSTRSSGATSSRSSSATGETCQRQRRAPRWTGSTSTASSGVTA